MEVQSVAPPQLFDLQQQALLRVVVSNPGPAGGPLLLWDSLGLQWESTPGVPLSATSAGALVARMDIYRDANGSESFEATNDLLVAQSTYLPLASAGTMNFAFAGSDPTALQVASGGAARFFVVVTLRGDASLATPASLRVTHLANGPQASTGRRASDGTLLSMVPAPDVSTNVLGLAPGAPPTTVGLVPLALQEPPRPALVPLHPAFADTEDAPAQLRYTVTGNTRPDLFTFVGIDPATGVLTVDPVSTAQGPAELTVQATDTSGKTVSTGLNLHLGPLATYAAFANAFFGSSGPGISGVNDDPARNGLSNLLKYAFFLHPLINADHAGLPTLTRTGRAKIFTHLRPKFSADLLFTYEKSTDLVTWEPAVEAVDYYAVTSDVGDGSQRVECLLLDSPGRRFLRARVQLTSPPPPGGETLAGAMVLPPALPPPVIGISIPQIPPALPPPPSSNPPLPISIGVAFPEESQVLSGSDLSFPHAIAATDMDADGWADLVCITEGDDKVSWYRNVNGTLGPRQVLSGQTRGGSGIATGDLTGDGLPEIVSASALDNKIAWYRNLGSSTVGSQQIITTGAPYATSVATGDMDRDGRVDIIAASGYGADAKIVWFRNLGAPGFFAHGQAENPLVSPGANARQTAGNLPFSIMVANLDGDPDGFMDVAVASFNDRTIAFLRGNGTNTFQRQVLSTTEPGAFGIALGDMDGDGLQDIVSACAQGTIGGRILWFKNNGPAPFGPPNIIAQDLHGLRGVTVADLNSDGRIDVVAGTVRGSASPPAPRGLWFRNLGGGNFGNPQANSQLISTGGSEAYSVAVADFDQSGQPDVAICWQGSSKLSIYRNRGGQISLTAADTAPALIYEAARDDVLRISLANLGNPGEDAARLTSLGLLFEKSPGVPMTADEANLLIDQVHLHADGDGSGTFDPASDPLLLTAFHLHPANGRANLSLQNAAPGLRDVPPGQTRRFFVVIQPTSQGSAQLPPTFRVSFLAAGAAASSTRSAVLDTALSAADAGADVPASLVTVEFNAPPTTLGLPALTVFDPTTASYVQLPTYFSDAEDGASQLTYTLIGNTNPGLFRFAGIEAGTNRLALKYRSGVPGSAILSVRATDSLGKAVTTSIAVTVGYTFNDWSNLNPPPDLGGGPQSAIGLYAFGLNPLSPGDLTQAPRMEQHGAVKILRHLRQRWASDLQYRYLVSSDLVEWSPAVPGIHYYEFRKPISGSLEESEIVVLTDWPSAFLRAEAQIP